MGIVRTQEELETIRENIESAEFLESQVLTIEYLTDPEIVERVLPPGLTPTDQPIVRAGFSNCKESVTGPFTGGVLYLRAQHEGLEGWYMLAMVYTTDAAINYGRELYYEPKKEGFVSVERDGDEIHGELLRFSETIMETDITLKEEAQPNPVSEPIFTYKFVPSLNGFGFAEDPQLMAMYHEDEVSYQETGIASLELSTSEPDPWGEIAVDEVLDASYLERDIHVMTEQEILTTVDGDKFLPYYYGSQRCHDWIQLNPHHESDLEMAPDSATRHGREGLHSGWIGFE